MKSIRLCESTLLALFTGFQIVPLERQPYVDTSAVEILYGGQFTLSLQLMKPNYL